MKKNKVDNKSAADFKNNPFKPLRGFTPKPGPAVNRIPTPPPEDPGEEDEASLFLRAAAGSRRLNRAPGTSGASVKQGDGEKSEAGSAREDSRLFFQAVQNIGAHARYEAPESNDDEAERRSSMSRMRQLKRGTIRIRGELDLHGHLKEAALVKLEHFIAGAHNRGQEAVLIITGKGINSPEGPVLQGAVATWLRENGKGLVAEFAPAPRDLGGSGAFVVFLKSAAATD
jgi:DNA-nicking Smr family endonuclease